MIKAILFDLDLTLTNRQYAAYKCFEKIVDKYFDISDWFEKESIIQQMLILDEFGNSDKKYIAKEMSKRYNLDYELIKDEFISLPIDMGPYTMLADNVLDVLKKLKEKYKLGIITNGSSLSQRAKIENLNINNLFDDIIIASEYALQKPDPEIFRLAAKRLDVQTFECLFVGDNLTNDIYGANLASMHYLLINNYRKWHYHKAIPYIDDISEIFNFLGKIDEGQK